MPRYKLSDARIFPVDGHSYLFLTEENAIFEMDAELEAFVREAQARAPLPWDGLLARLQGDAAQKRDLLDLLLRHFATRPKSTCRCKPWCCMSPRPATWGVCTATMARAGNPAAPSAACGCRWPARPLIFSLPIALTFRKLWWCFSAVSLF
jgi:hypothetical protein